MQSLRPLPTSVRRLGGLLATAAAVVFCLGIGGGRGGPAAWSLAACGLTAAWFSAPSSRDLRVETPLWLGLALWGAALPAGVLAMVSGGLARARTDAGVDDVLAGVGRGGLLVSLATLASLGGLGGSWGALGLAGVLSMALQPRWPTLESAPRLMAWMGAGGVAALVTTLSAPEDVAVLAVVMVLFQQALHGVDHAEAARAREAELTRLAERDELTGLGNVRALRAAVQAQLGERLGILVLDLDGFKELNDTHGHFAGDRALRAVGEVLAAYPGVDFFRAGGDEFVGLFGPEDDAAIDAHCVPVRQALEGLEVAVRGGSFPVRVSLGVAVGRHDGTEAIRRLADAEMYADKRGRTIQDLRPSGRLVFERYDERIADSARSIPESSRSVAG